MPDNAVASEADPSGTPWLSNNLKLRILSGAVLASVAFLLAFAGPLPFAFLILVCALVISWEWGRLVRGATFDLGFFVHAIAVAAAIVLAGAGYAALAVAVLAIAA
ncbi:MAG: phosphatidate cytidylyltransferase, partial [Hyphomicrobium sp.]